MGATYQGKYFLSASEADAEAKLSLTGLTSKLIEIATEHANALGIGNPVMQHLHAGWILSRLTIEMCVYPEINSFYVVKTWIEDFNRHFSTRCFSVESPEGIQYGFARSVWLVLDYERHINFGTSHLQLSKDDIAGEGVPIARQEKHIMILPEEAELPATKKILVANHPVVNHRFLYCDLDYYRHVNTVKYVALLLNQFSLEEHDSTIINRLELSFLHEAGYGEETLLLRHDDTDNPLNSSFQLSDKKNGNVLLFARVVRNSHKFN